MSASDAGDCATVERQADRISSKRSGSETCQRPKPDLETARASGRIAPPKAILTFNGNALRHLRRAQEIALRHGTCLRIRRELMTAREAVDLALWACDYAEAE